MSKLYWAYFALGMILGGTMMWSFMTIPWHVNAVIYGGIGVMAWVAHMRNKLAAS